jgi:hypothetical protein
MMCAGLVLPRLPESQRILEREFVRINEIFKWDGWSRMHVSARLDWVYDMRSQDALFFSGPHSSRPCVSCLSPGPFFASHARHL